MPSLGDVLRSSSQRILNEFQMLSGTAKKKKKQKTNEQQKKKKQVQVCRMLWNHGLVIDL